MSFNSPDVSTSIMNIHQNRFNYVMLREIILFSPGKIFKCSQGKKEGQETQIDQIRRRNFALSFTSDLLFLVGRNFPMHLLVFIFLLLSYEEFDGLMHIERNFLLFNLSCNSTERDFFLLFSLVGFVGEFITFKSHFVL